MNKLYFISAFLPFVFTSCTEKESVLPENLYNQKANEFVATLLKYQDFNCNCVIEPRHTLLDYMKIERPTGNMEKVIMKWTNIKSQEVKDSLNTLSKQVNLNTTIIKSGYKLISARLADSIVRIKDRDERIRVMDSLCPKGFMTLSKPFFNKSMDTVFIQIDNMPYSCLSMPISFYYYLNNDWIINY